MSIIATYGRYLTLPGYHGDINTLQVPVPRYGISVFPGIPLSNLLRKYSSGQSIPIYGFYCMKADTTYQAVSTRCPAYHQHCSSHQHAG